MRLITKWCEQLKQYFDNDDQVLNRSTQFRMRDRSESFLNKTHRVIIKNLLDNENKRINKFLEQIAINNSESQFYFANIAYNKDLAIFSENESAVGIFSSAVRQNYDFYQLRYLNELIHGLLKVN